MSFLDTNNVDKGLETRQLAGARRIFCDSGMTYHAVATLALREQTRPFGADRGVAAPFRQTRSDNVRVHPYDVGERKVSVGPK